MKVICIVDCPWTVGIGPKKDETVTVNWRNETYLGFIEYPRAPRLSSDDEPVYNKKFFRPLNPLEAWNRDEQESFLEYVEKIAEGVERETVEK